MSSFRKLPSHSIQLCHRGTHARVVVAAAQRGADRSCRTWRTTRCRSAHVRVRGVPSADQIVWSPDRRRTAILAGLPQLLLWSRQCHQWRRQPPLRWRTGQWSMPERLPAGTSTCPMQTRLVQWDQGGSLARASASLYMRLIFALLGFSVANTCAIGLPRPRPASARRSPRAAARTASDSLARGFSHCRRLLR